MLDERSFGVGLVFYVRLTPIILLYCYCFCPSYICPRSLFWGMMKTMPMSWHCPKQKNIPSRCTFISSAPGGRLKQSCYHGLTICLWVLSVYIMFAMDFPAVLHDLKKKMKSFSNFCNFNSTIFRIEWHEWILSTQRCELNLFSWVHNSLYTGNLTAGFVIFG